MRDGLTEKFRYQRSLVHTDGVRIDAGTLLTFLTTHVVEHLDDQRYPILYPLGCDEVPPQADVYIDQGRVVLMWTDRDVSEHNAAVKAARDAKDRTADTVPTAGVTDGAADTV